MPSISLPSTSKTHVDLSTSQSLTVLFCYPRTGAPSETVPDSWDSIPGARGCTPQACSFRDAYKELLQAGVKQVFGLSTQDTAYQKEAKDRLNLPYELLSDEQLEFLNALRMPTFEWEGKAVVKRTTLAIENGRIVRVWYPVFPPNKSADKVLEWLRNERSAVNNHQLRDNEQSER
ncbi:MAG: hypothetical protein M1830_000241 [Pleopsidium flavum]|nr:MAG: hypothetical protein M1830_000241 [Pleopsidium flavum]